MFQGFPEWPIYIMMILLALVLAGLIVSGSTWGNQETQSWKSWNKICM